MSETTITCPRCQHSFALTAAMSSAIETRLRRELEAEAAERVAALEAREKAILQKSRDEQAALARRKEQLEQREQAISAEIAKRVQAERAAIAAAEAEKARAALADELTRARQEKAATEELLKARDAKLVEATKKELELRRKQKELEDARRELELDVERRLAEERAKLREAALKEADEQHRLKLAEKEKTIADLSAKLQEAVRKAEQGSQQLQGEVLELEIEALLRAKFPRDVIEPVPKGEFGGDVIHRVIGPAGQVCGTILWESKRTRNWSDGWLGKLREDHRKAKADVAIIVSQALPKDVETFDQVDGVWVTGPRCAIPVAIALRHSLVELATARQALTGQQSKMELVYQYLTGPRFRHRIQAIVEAFTIMQEDLEREKKAIMKQWSKRAEQIDRVMQATVGMYGDLQGIAGRTLQEIEGMDVKLLGGDGNGNGDGNGEKDE